MSSTIYPSAAAHINHHPYTVMAPPYIQSIHKAVEKGDLFAPIYETFDDKAPQRAKIPITKMVELYISNTSFTIIDDYDVLVILHQIDAYVAEVYPLRNDPRYKDYLEKILRLRTRIYAVFRRVLNRHPQWKQVYIGDQGIFGVIRDLYRPLGIDVGMPVTLLEELAICPTVRANPDPVKPAAQPDLEPTTPSNTRSIYDV